MVGNMRNKVTFQKPEEVPDGQGGFLLNFSDYYSDWADVKPLNGLRSLEYYKVFNRQPYLITTRDRRTQPVEPGMKVKHGLKTMMIHSIIEKGINNQFIELIAYYND